MVEFLFAFPSLVRANQHYQLHAHSYHELVLVQQGRYRSRVNDQDYVAFRGDILFYTARTAHEEWAEDNKPVQTWVCAFNHEGLGPDEPVFRWDAHGRVWELLAKLTELHLADVVWNEEVRHMGEALPLLGELVAELQHLTAYESHGMIDQVRAFIRAHMNQPLTVDDLAAVAGISKSYFVGRYRELTGRTPMEDVRIMRLEEARRLILTTKLPLHEIAPRIGIANEYHLSRLLKSVLSVSVRDLRQHQKD